jgi:hypothetical protein
MTLLYIDQPRTKNVYGNVGECQAASWWSPKDGVRTKRKTKRGWKILRTVEPNHFSYFFKLGLDIVRANEPKSSSQIVAMALSAERAYVAACSRFGAHPLCNLIIRHYKPTYNLGGVWEVLQTRSQHCKLSAVGASWLPILSGGAVVCHIKMLLLLVRTNAPQRGIQIPPGS